MQQLPEEYGYSLPDFKITTEQQQAIVAHVKALYESGVIKPTGYTSLNYSGKPFIYAMALRNAFSDGVRQPSNMLHRFANHEWEWEEENELIQPVTAIVKDVLAPLTHLYTMLTRVVILLQIPGLAIPLHRDYHDHNDVGHSWNRHLTIKFPLTEIAGDNGTPVLGIDGKQFRYETGTSAFLLNEVDIEHGSLPAKTTRGVIFIDGLIDFSKVDMMNRKAIELEELPVLTTE